MIRPAVVILFSILLSMLKIFHNKKAKNAFKVVTVNSLLDSLFKKPTRNSLPLFLLEG